MTDSSTSVVNSLNTWLTSVYKVRSHLYKLKNECFQNLDKHIAEDIGDVKYQRDYSSEESANAALGENLESKYSWLKWVS